jgi:hypothetical protein
MAIDAMPALQIAHPDIDETHGPNLCTAADLEVEDREGAVSIPFSTRRRWMFSASSVSVSQPVGLARGRYPQPGRTAYWKPQPSPKTGAILMKSPVWGAVIIMPLPM